MPNISAYSVFAVLVLLTQTQAFPRYRDGTPNSRNVIVNGVRVNGLGHGSLTAGSTSFGNANAFGKLVDNVFQSRQQLWPVICEQDPDNDGRTNGVELCDPGCTWRFGDNDPQCGGNVVLTHPGIFEEVAADGTVTVVGGAGANLPLNQQIHAALMIISWVFLAPTGILMALARKKSGNPQWFKVHKACLFSAAVLTVFGFLAMLIPEGTEALTNNVPHAKFGIIVVLLAIAQPISGYFRVHLPPKGQLKSFKRLLWEFQHQWTGRAAMIFAAFAVSTGIDVGFGNPGGGAIVAILFIVATLICFVYVLLFREKQVENLRKSRNILDASKNVPPKAVAVSAGAGTMSLQQQYDEYRQLKYQEATGGRGTGNNGIQEVQAQVVSVRPAKEVQMVYPQNNGRESVESYGAGYGNSYRQSEYNESGYDESYETGYATNEGNDLGALYEQRGDQNRRRKKKGGRSKNKDQPLF